MKFSKSAIVAVAISGLLLAGCSSKAEQPSSSGSANPSASSQGGDMHGVIAEYGLMPHDLSTKFIEGYVAGNFDESKAKKLLTSNRNLAIVAVTDNGVIVGTEEGPLFINLNGGQNLQMEPNTPQAPIVVKWEGKQYVVVVSEKLTDKETSDDPLAKDLGGTSQYANVYDLETGKLVKKHEFVVPGEGAKGWSPMQQNYPRSFIMEMVGFDSTVTPKYDTYGIQVINPLTGEVTDEFTKQDQKLMETFSGATPDGKIIREVEPGVYGYGGHLFPKGEVVTGVNGQYAVTVNQEAKQTKLYVISSEAPKEIISDPVFCNTIPASSVIAPQYNEDQEYSSFSPDERYVAFGHSVFDTKNKTLKCLTANAKQESVQPVAVDNAGNIYAYDGHGRNGTMYMVNFETGKASKVHNRIDAITKSGMGVVYSDSDTDDPNYFLPVK